MTRIMTSSTTPPVIDSSTSTAVGASTSAGTTTTTGSTATATTATVPLTHPTTVPTSRPARSSSPGSYYAMSDEEEGDYNTITHTSTGRGVKLLYTKSKVYIHPTPSAKDNIPGYIALLQQRGGTQHDRPRSSSSSSGRDDHPASSDLLLAWIPESSLGESANLYVKVDLCDGDSPPKQSYLVPPPPTVTTHRGSVGPYAFAIPVSAIYSLLIRPPSVGWWWGSIIINSRAGDSFPALFFHDSECQSTILQKKKRTADTFDPFGDAGQMFWGGDEVLRWLKRYVQIERSGAEPNIYLVEPSKEDSVAFGGKPTTSGTKQGESSRAGPGGKKGEEASMDPFVKLIKEAGWNLMEKFSKVTTFTRQAANDVLDNPRVPPQMRRLLRNPEVQTLQDEFDSARIYLARWAMGIAEQSDRDRNRRIWTARDVMELEDTDVGEFELVDGANSLSLEERRKVLTMKEWKGFFDERTGRLSVTVDEVKERIFHGGLDPEDGVRKEAWLFLLGVYDWYSTADERKAQAASLRDAYIKLKGAWWERQVDLGGEGEEGEWWREQRNRIGTNVHMEQLKDMLLTYNEYNKGLGYVQGMSDLLAPIYAVLQDDALAFWAFQHFMDRMERNFLRDQSGMRAQLLALDNLVRFMDPKLYAHLESADSTNFFFFFRMLLVWYKREFEWDDVLRLWEALWTDYLSSGFHLFIALAILERHRDVIMTHLKHFDEVLKYVNELSTTIDLESTLIRAEALFQRFRRLIEAIDRKEHFPGPRRTLSTATSASATAALAENKAEGSKLPSPPLPPRPQSGPRAASSPATATNKGKNAAAKTAEEDKEEKVEKIVTPALRKLLSREVEIIRAPVKEGQGYPTRERA
ncbi:putative GTPase activating protein [Sordaria brevicollis]|uniref:GTPase-activating protein GYP7 n=1 Tax=Sordaria brevicollis TaxID=83679 RepID=A0AAE0PFD3_SORBR|nr:putative GTPase activating protein [Sordaria brevicollis]